MVRLINIIDKISCINTASDATVDKISQYYVVRDETIVKISYTNVVRDATDSCAAATGFKI